MDRGVDDYDPDMTLNPDQFNRPGTGYSPDPSTKGITRFKCESCGSRYEAPVKMDPAIVKMSSCRNKGCSGPVTRV